MSISLSLTSLATLFVSMLVLAALPSLSVLAVTTRAAASGFIQGVYTTAGIVLGDAILILLAVLGLSALAAALGPGFGWIQSLGGLYLLWMGFRMLRGAASLDAASTATPAPTSSWSSFMTGLLLTLGDQKALLFYLGFFPAFVDLRAITAADIALILGLTLVAVGGVKLVYAYFADRARSLMSPALQRGLHRLAAGLLMAVGIFVLLRY